MRLGLSVTRRLQLRKTEARVCGRSFPFPENHLKDHCAIKSLHRNHEQQNTSELPDIKSQLTFLFFLWQKQESVIMGLNTEPSINAFTAVKMSCFMRLLYKQCISSVV